MSILIKGMRMPENCIKCPMQFGGICYVMPAEVDESRVAPTVEEALKQGKPDWCPLIEISKPHGDLIDRDALVKDLTNGIKAGLFLDGYEEYQNINDMDDCVECVKYTDAVIEAEGSENHDD